MNETSNHNPLSPTPEEDRPEVDPTLDLDLAEFEEVKDLQALADEVAESTSEPSAQAEAGKHPREEMEASLFKARQRIAELEKQEAEQKDKHHRLLADFANHRNRVGRETQLAVTLAEKKLLLELLPVVDSFERCLASNYSNVEDLQNGIELIYKQLMESLRKAGVTGVNVKPGDPFDAHLAEALTTTNQPSLADGAVAAVYERGYMLKDLLLRPARVIVNHTHPRHNDGSPE